MKSYNFTLVRYDADDGCVFDWKEPRYIDILGKDGVPTGEREQEHLYSKTLFIGVNDSIENYVEVDEHGNATELIEDIATIEDYENALAELEAE